MLAHHIFLFSYLKKEKNNIIFNNWFYELYVKLSSYKTTLLCPLFNVKKKMYLTIIIIIILSGYN